APVAWAVRPAVAMRKEPKLQKTKLKTIDPRATAPSRCASPRRPITVASTRPRRGVVTCDKVMGSARASMRRCVTSMRRDGAGPCMMGSRGACLATAEQACEDPERHDDDGAVDDPEADLLHRLQAE